MAHAGYKQRVRDALPGTIPQIVLKTGVSRVTVQTWLRRMRLAGECHIGDWIKSGNWHAPYWVDGPGDDEPYTHLALTNAEYSRRWRSSKPRAELREIARTYAMRARQKKKTEQTIKQGDPIINHLFGRIR